MSKKLHRISKRKGLSEMVGAVFILVLIAVGSGFALTMFTAFTGYQNAVDTRAQYNAQFSREQLSYSGINLGGSQAYSPALPLTLPASITGTSSPASVFRPITNMNFTSNSDGWTFTKKYISPATVGMSGNFDPISSEGSASGPGLIFTDFTVNQGSGSSVTAVGNWTTVFTLTAQQIATLSSGTSTITFRIGDNLPAVYNYNAGSGSPVMTAFLLDPGNRSKVITIALATPPTSGVWTNFDSTPTLLTTHRFFHLSSGTYDFVLQTSITLKRLNSGASEQRVYFDDTGIRLLLTGYDTATICPVFHITQTPSSVQDLKIAVTSFYSISVTQTISMWNYAQAGLTSVDVSTVGASSTTRTVDLGGSGGASQAQGYIRSGSTTSVTIAGCSNSPIPASQGTVIMEIGTIGVGGYTGSLTGDTLTVYYTNTNQFSFTLVNGGSETIHLVSLWVSGSPSTLHMASTLTGGFNFDRWVSPGQTVTITVSYSWTPGQYTVELVSARGNLFTETFSAS